MVAGSITPMAAIPVFAIHEHGINGTSTDTNSFQIRDALSINATRPQFSMNSTITPGVSVHFNLTTTDFNLLRQDNSGVATGLSRIFDFTVPNPGDSKINIGAADSGDHINIYATETVMNSTRLVGNGINFAIDDNNSNGDIRLRVDDGVVQLFVEEGTEGTDVSFISFTTGAVRHDLRLGSLDGNDILNFYSNEIAMNNTKITNTVPQLEFDDSDSGNADEDSRLQHSGNTFSIQTETGTEDTFETVFSATAGATARSVVVGAADDGDTIELNGAVVASDNIQAAGPITSAAATAIIGLNSTGTDTDDVRLQDDDADFTIGVEAGVDQTYETVLNIGLDGTTARTISIGAADDGDTIELNGATIASDTLQVNGVLTASSGGTAIIGLNSTGTATNDVRFQDNDGDFNIDTETGVDQAYEGVISFGLDGASRTVFIGAADDADTVELNGGVIASDTFNAAGAITSDSATAILGLNSSASNTNDFRFQDDGVNFTLDVEGGVDQTYESIITIPSGGTLRNIQIGAVDNADSVTLNGVATVESATVELGFNSTASNTNDFRFQDDGINFTLDVEGGVDQTYESIITIPSGGTLRNIQIGAVDNADSVTLNGVATVEATTAIIGLNSTASAANDSRLVDDGTTFSIQVEDDGGDQDYNTIFSSTLGGAAATIRLGDTTGQDDIQIRGMIGLNATKIYSSAATADVPPIFNVLNGTATVTNGANAVTVTGASEGDVAHCTLAPFTATDINNITIKVLTIDTNVVNVNATGDTDAAGAFGDGTINPRLNCLVFDITP